MNIQITDKKENILLSRIEVRAEISFEGKATPSNGEVKSELSKALSVDKGLIVLKNIKTSFGDAKAKVLAYQYLSKDELEKVESVQPEQQASQPEKKPEQEKKEPPEEEKKEVPEEKPQAEPKQEQTKPE